jgi:hypothetical protein
MSLRRRTKPSTVIPNRTVATTSNAMNARAASAGVGHRSGLSTASHCKATAGSRHLNQALPSQFVQQGQDILFAAVAIHLIPSYHGLTQIDRCARMLQRFPEEHSNAVETKVVAMRHVEDDDLGIDPGEDLLSCGYYRRGHGEERVSDALSSHYITIRGR